MKKRQKRGFERALGDREVRFRAFLSRLCPPVLSHFSGLLKPSFTSIELNGTLLRAELATTWLQRLRGLSGRKSLGDIDGLLFIFPWRARWRMCMRGMKFPLTFIWMNDYKVVATDENISPGYRGTIRPPQKVNMVLEVRGKLSIEGQIKNETRHIRHRGF